MQTIDHHLKHVRLTALIIAGLTLILVGLGGFVRATGAGLACPDWPLCFGRVIPDTALPGVTQEVTHRVVAGLVAVASVYLWICSYRLRRTHQMLFKNTTALLLLLGVQVVFGALTVTMRLNPLIVTGHLVLGTVFFQCMGLIGIERLTGLSSNSSSSGRFSLLVLAAVVLTSIQIALGGFVGSSGASLICMDLPACNGRWLPDLVNGPETVQILHRLLGTALVALVLLAAILAGRTDGLASKRRGHLFGVTFLCFVQLALGVLNVFYFVPYWITVPHLVVAQMILLGLASLYKELNPVLRVFAEEPQSLSKLHEAGDVQMIVKRAANTRY